MYLKPNKKTDRKIAVLFAFLLTIVSSVSPVWADDPWLQEFEDICGMTLEAESMTPDQLKAMVERCDKLKPVIERSENPQRKVYIFRLDKCKNLFLYVLDVTGGSK